jgi:hypothetical protein
LAVRLALAALPGLALVAMPVWEETPALVDRPARVEMLALVLVLVETLALEALRALAVRPVLLAVLLAREMRVPRPTPTRRGTFSTTPSLSPSSAKAAPTPPPTAVKSPLHLLQSAAQRLGYQSCSWLDFRTGPQTAIPFKIATRRPKTHTGQPDKLGHPQHLCLLCISFCSCFPNVHSAELNGRSLQFCLSCVRTEITSICIKVNIFLLRILFSFPCFPMVVVCCIGRSVPSLC